MANHHQDEAPRLAGGGGYAGHETADTVDCADALPTDQSGGKRFATLQARLALKGWTLTRARTTDGAVKLHATRWGMVRELADLASVEAFAEQVGAKP